MVENEDKTRAKNGLLKNIVINTMELVTNITHLDLSNGTLRRPTDRKSRFDETLELPPNIVRINLSNNELTEVPHKILKLNNLKSLDLSSNLIVFFDDTPSFCHTIEWLNLSHNCLEGPPFWVWSEKPKKLAYLNLSNNIKLYESFNGAYFDKLLQYQTLVYEIDMHNCGLNVKYVKFMATFCRAKVVTLGYQDYIAFSVNNLEQLPCAGLEECRELERMTLNNTQLLHINSNIDIYQHLKEINLAQNNLTSLPNEFCNLKNLETCIMSCNKILYLPDNMGELTKLVRLYLDDNKLCMLPHTLHKISSLKTLDLYNNDLREGFNEIDNIEELDFAQNYFEEPDDEKYLVKRLKLRVNSLYRQDGSRIEDIQEGNCDLDDYEELYDLTTKECFEDHDVPYTQCSSPEDWDSDDHWIPLYYKPVIPLCSPWVCFVKKKMEEGNFCPMDAHVVSIAEKVKYEKYCNPPVVHEIEGQFDDYSDDDS